MLQSARSVWRQSSQNAEEYLLSDVAICTERVEAKGQEMLGVLRGVVAICTGRVEAKMVTSLLYVGSHCCNLHGACGGKEDFRHGCH